MESRWAVNPKVRRGDHTFLMVSDFLTNPGFPADSCSVWVASGRMHVDIIVNHRWITEFTGNGSNGKLSPMWEKRGEQVPGMGQDDPQ